MSDPAEETNGEATSKGRSSASVDARKADFASLRNARANAGVHKAHVRSFPHELFQYDFSTRF